MEPPIGFIALPEAVEQLANARSLSCEQAQAVIAEACECGELSAAYRSIMGADELDPSLWRSTGSVRNYFATGTIDLDLPLLDDCLRPNKDGLTARCTREIFIRRDSLRRLIAGLGPLETSEPALGKAPAEKIRTEVRALYLETKADPPNINKLPKIVRRRLNAQGFDASDRQIKKIGEEPEFARLRRPVGRQR